MQNMHKIAPDTRKLKMEERVDHSWEQSHLNNTAKISSEGNTHYAEHSTYTRVLHQVRSASSPLGVCWRKASRLLWRTHQATHVSIFLGSPVVIILGTKVRKELREQSWACW